MCERSNRWLGIAAQPRRPSLRLKPGRRVADKDWPRIFRPTAILASDWCHQCGRRSYGQFVVMNVPVDAEHRTSIESRGFFRFCETCVASWSQSMATHAEQFAES